MVTVDTSDWVTKSSTFTLPYSDFNDSDGFYNGVKMRISIWCGSGNGGQNIPNAYGIYFDDVRIKATVPEDIYYNSLPEADSSNACCPKEWCWDGMTCVNSTRWHNNSQEPPIWNSIFASPWFNEHVNASQQYRAKGYRCVLNEGIAEWQPARIKYDYEFKKSGYCNNQNNCFVGGGLKYDATGDSCIPNATFIQDKSSNAYGFGNHLCRDGEWTTRTYVAASYLTAWAGSDPYVLICGNNSIFNYNLNNMPPEDPYYELGSIVDSCSITIKEGPDQERVIIAIIPHDPQSGNPEGIERVYRSLIAIYEPLFQDNSENWAMEFEECHRLDETSDEWFDCIRAGIFGTDPENLDIYYNSHYQFLIVSDSQIPYIDPTWLQQVWNYMLNFFERLFGLAGEETQYRLFGQTANFNQIYVLNNTPLFVEGIEEEKYDEIQYEVLTYLYLNYTPNTTDFDIDTDYITTYYTPLYLNYTNAYGTKEFIMIDDARSELWPYFTAMLRDR
jgi:hypothetical protein